MKLMVGSGNHTTCHLVRLPGLIGSGIEAQHGHRIRREAEAEGLADSI
jgi:hypothetical protein